MQDAEALIFDKLQSADPEERIRGLEIIKQTLVGGFTSFALKQGLRQDEAEEAFQETLIAIWKGVERGSLIRRPFTYFWTIGRCKINDQFRKRRSKKEDQMGSWSDESEQETAIQFDPATAMKLVELMTILATAISTFPDAERKAGHFMLEFFKTYQELPTAADLMKHNPELTMANAQKQLWRVKELLRKDREKYRE